MCVRRSHGESTDGDHVPGKLRFSFDGRLGEAVRAAVLAKLWRGIPPETAAGSSPTLNAEQQRHGGRWATSELPCLVGGACWRGQLCGNFRPTRSPRPNRPLHGPSRSEEVHTLAGSAPSAAEFGEYRPRLGLNSGNTWTKSTPSSAESRPSSVRPALPKICSKSDHIRPVRHPIRPMLSKIKPMAVEVAPYSAEVGPNSAELGRIRPISARTLPNSGDVDRDRPELGKRRPSCVAPVPERDAAEVRRSR